METMPEVLIAYGVVLVPESSWVAKVVASNAGRAGVGGWQIALRVGRNRHIPQPPHPRRPSCQIIVV